MKLRYLKAKNVLSFGDEGIELEFGPYNVIVGPNDSGKTNLFRVLKLIEKAFDYREPSLDGILFQGDMNRSLHLEVGVELDDTEIELLSTLIICSEILSARSSEINEYNFWESILKKYGYAILSKSLRCLSFVLEKDELITSEPKMVLKISNESGSIFMDRRSQLSETPEELGSYQREPLVRLIINDFNSKYENIDDIEINKLLQNEGKLSKECPSLVELLIGKLEGDPIKKIVALGGSSDINQLSSDLRGEPFISNLSRLCQQRKIGPQHLYPWNILQQLYRTSFVQLQELRISPPSLDSSSTSQDYGESTILGNDLARKLFWLTNSGTPSDREKYNKIQEEFVKLTGSEFDVAIRTRDVTDVSEGEFGVLIPPEPERAYQSRFIALGIGKESKTRVMNEAYIQVIKNNYPIAIEQTASGLYEILFLLTTIIGESEKILLLDEPELHLHPNLQKRILDLLSESKVQSGNQIVMITHSPYLVSIEEIDMTWRFSKREIGTKAHNLGRMFLELESQEQQEFTVKLSSPIIRSLLFSRGVIFVEGLSDKIAVEQIDRYLSTKNEGANIDENEWSIIDIGGKYSLSKYIELSRMMDIPNVAIMDHDYLEELRELYNENQFFVFSTDLEGALQSQETKTRKPLKALQRIIELIDQDNIPQEFYEMCKFLRKYTIP